MADQLKGKRVAALATHGFEQDELFKPRKALEEAGAKVDVISPESGSIRGWKHRDWGDHVSVDRTLDQGRSGGRRGSRCRVVTQARRHPCIQSEDDRGVRRRQARRRRPARNGRDARIMIECAMTKAELLSLLNAQ